MNVLFDEKTPFGDWKGDAWMTPSVKEWRTYLKDAGLDIEDPEVFQKTYEDFMTSGVAQEMSSQFEKEPLIKAVSDPKGMFYLLLSALQKAIRYGYTREAMLYYRSLVEMGFDAQTRTRLRTIVYEDIGLGDPFLCALVMRLTDSQFVAREMMECVIMLMCETDKSRIQTDVWQMFTYFKPGALAAQIDDLDEKTPMETLTPLQTFALAMKARGNKNADYLKGYKRMTANPGLLKHMADEMMLPPEYRHMLKWCENTAIPFHAGLMATMPFALKYGMETTQNPIKPNMDLRETLEGSKILSAGLDQHTSLGKRAMAYAMKMAPKLVPPEYVTEVTPKLDVLGHAIFRIEGAWLWSIMGNSVMNGMWVDAMVSCWEIEGWKDKSEALAYYDDVRDNFDKIRVARNRIWK